MYDDRRWLELIMRLGRVMMESVGDTSLEAFRTDADRVDAAAFRIQHIGEAAGRLSPALHARHPDAPWPAMVRMRNILAHAYEEIAPRVLWTVIQNDLRPLLAICEQEIARQI